MYTNDYAGINAWKDDLWVHSCDYLRDILTFEHPALDLLYNILEVVYYARMVMAENILRHLKFSEGIITDVPVPQYFLLCGKRAPV